MAIFSWFGKGNEDNQAALTAKRRFPKRNRNMWPLAQVRYQSQAVTRSEIKINEDVEVDYLKNDH